MRERKEKREKEVKEALENEAKERGFDSVEAMQKADDDKLVEEEAKRVQVENSTEAQIKEEVDTGEEEVTSDDKENTQV